MGLVEAKRRPTNASSEQRSTLLRERMRTPDHELSRAQLAGYFPELIFCSESMCRILNTVLRAAASESTVLILGESGTGKELIARALHYLSDRAAKPFIPINCSAIPEALLESELFGHTKGAFTGADKSRNGIFHQAHNGSIFLDEIGDMPLSLQAKLLRILQDKRYTPVGGQESLAANVRIIAATNVDLQRAVHNGSFRLDLYYRINVLPICVPPLRSRFEDIPELIEYFIARKMSQVPAQQAFWISEPAMRWLTSYAWPGNVRQLENLVERLFVSHSGREVTPENMNLPLFADFELCPQDTLRSPPAVPQAPPESCRNPLPEWFPTLAEDSPICLNSFLRQIEDQLIAQALSLTHNNKNRAAKLLGLNRTTLVERLKKRQIQD